MYSVMCVGTRTVIWDGSDMISNLCVLYIDQPDIYLGGAPGNKRHASKSMILFPKSYSRLTGKDLFMMVVIMICLLFRLMVLQEVQYLSIYPAMRGSAFASLNNNIYVFMYILVNLCPGIGPSEIAFWLENFHLAASVSVSQSFVSKFLDPGFPLKNSVLPGFTARKFSVDNFIQDS